MLEKAIISGVAHDTGGEGDDVPRAATARRRGARLFAALADAAVNIDTIVQNVSSTARPTSRSRCRRPTCRRRADRSTARSSVGVVGVATTGSARSRSSAPA